MTKMKISLYTLTSSLHDKNAVDAVSIDFIESVERALGFKMDFAGDDFSTYGKSDLDLIFVRTGGSEGLFKKVYDKLDGDVLLLTSGKSNSLAASLEILSFLNQEGRKGEVLHGGVEYIARRIEILAKVSKARRQLCGQKLGIIGEPSDWLISSRADKDAVKRKLGLELVDIPINELIEEASKDQDINVSNKHQEIISGLRKDAPEIIKQYVEGAIKIYGGMKSIVDKYELSGLTVRCFDLLSTLGNTGCLALALLNAEGIPAGCEGDIPALLSMAIGNALTGQCGFQSNPSQIDPVLGQILLAHCTVPLNMVCKWSYNTHFESGIGVAVHGELPEGDATVFKVSGDLSRAFCEEASLMENRYGDNLCRTQILLQFASPSVCSGYFLTNPIGNHHIVFTGKQKELFSAFTKSMAVAK